MTTNIPGQQPVLILDFDGTVALGDGPVMAYAQAVAKDLESAKATGLLDTVQEFLSGESTLAFKDGYDAVARLSENLLSRGQLNAAYRQSRDAIAAGQVAVHLPPGLTEFLADIEGYAQRVLFTNAPLTGVTESLQALGLAESIDAVVPEAGKPAGFATWLPKFLAGRSAEQLLSVGDVWANDIEIPLKAGCSTAFVDRFNLKTGPAHLRAQTIEQLYPGIQDWATDPVAFQLHHSLPQSSLDR